MRFSYDGSIVIDLRFVTLIFLQYIIRCVVVFCQVFTSNDSGCSVFFMLFEHELFTYNENPSRCQGVSDRHSSKGELRPVQSLTVLAVVIGFLR